MSLTIETLKALQSPAGAALLTELETLDLSESNTLRLITTLRKSHPSEIAAAALEMARLRLKGRAKFGERAAGMFFTRDALEQATDQRISRYRFGSAALQGQIAGDFGCSSGGDTLALAESDAAHVIGVDLDPVRLVMARANVTSPNAHFVQADLTRPLPFSDKLNFAFFDPARRHRDGRRIFSVRDYVPPLDIFKTWPRLRLMIKLSPGVNVSELPGGRVEFISLDGELKEAVLHLPAPPERRATLIQADGSVDQFQRVGAEPPLDLTPPRAVLYEPDPAVIRAGLVQDLGAQLNAMLLDPTIAYLTADYHIETPFARAWQIEDWMPFNLKKLRAYLRERDIGRVTVKKRGSPITPEELIAKLHLPGDGAERVIVLTRVQGEPAIIVANYFT